MSTFGRLFRVTTFGESHCKGVGAIVDGVPSCLQLTEEDIQLQLTRRRPGQSKLTTPRDEKDQVTILSGTENGYTLGTPIGLFVPNENIRPQDYKEMDTIPRPGHADYMYQMKYGTRASSGGGRSSARETIGRVAAGAIAEKWLKDMYQTTIVAWVSSIGTIDMSDKVIDYSINNEKSNLFTRNQVDTMGTLIILRDPMKWKKIVIKNDENKENKENKEILLKKQSIQDEEYEKYFFSEKGIIDRKTLPAYIDFIKNEIYTSEGEMIKNHNIDITKWKTDDIIPVRCPEIKTACKMATLVREVKLKKDSTGGIITCVITNVPIGLGEPCFDKLEAMLAHAMLSLPATKGFEIGSGFDGTRLRGSVHNDPFTCMDHNNKILGTNKNHAGGILGGISNGNIIYFRVAIKPVSTIGQPQKTVDYNGKSCVLEAKGRHDPCVLPRAVPLVEAMAALVLADAALIQKSRNPIILNNNVQNSIENNTKKQKIK